jgi:hypothetical protein
MSRISLLVVCFTLVAVPGALFADDAPKNWQLRYRFADDQELHYRIDDQKKIEVQVGGAGDTVRHTSHTLRRHLVKHVGEDGAATFELTILRVQMQASSGNDVIEFDSAVDEQPPAEFRGIQGTIGQPLGQVTISPRGVVSDTQLLIPAQNEEEFAAAQRDLMPILPESPVAVGDTWRDPFEVDVVVSADQLTAEKPLKKRIRLERVYSLEAVEDGIANIAVRTVVLSPVEDAFQEGQLIQRTTNGTVQFDVERGLLVDRTVTLENTVVGFQGPKTSLAVEGSHQDVLVPETDLAAELPETMR